MKIEIVGKENLEKNLKEFKKLFEIFSEDEHFLVIHGKSQILLIPLSSLGKNELIEIIKMQQKIINEQRKEIEDLNKELGILLGCKE